MIETDINMNVNEKTLQSNEQIEQMQSVDILPNQTLYINNLNEKIKLDGMNIFLFFNF